MVMTVVSIERGVEDAWSIRDAGTSNKRKESQTASSSRGFRDRAAAIRAKARPGLLASLSRSHVIIAISLDM